MNKKLYVGNLPYTVTSDDLRKFFADAGTVIDAVVIAFKDTGRSKGFGFVEMETEDMAKMAIEKFNGADMSGRKVIVSEARAQENPVSGATPAASPVSAVAEPVEVKEESPKAEKPAKATKKVAKEEIKEEVKAEE